MAVRPPRPRPRDRDADGRPLNQRPRDRLGRPLPRSTTEVALAEDWPCEDPERALRTAAWLWDQQRFFEAHECLETVWQAAPEEDREFWKGLIQIAVGFCHHQRGNLQGAVTLLRRGARRLAAYPDVHHGIDVGELRGAALAAAAALTEAGAVVEVGYPEFATMDDGPWVELPEARGG